MRREIDLTLLLSSTPRHENSAQMKRAAGPIVRCVGHRPPTVVKRRPADRGTAVEVQQTIRDLAGDVLKDGKVRHLYRFEGGGVKDMTIR